jgi:putative transposase
MKQTLHHTNTDTKQTKSSLAKKMGISRGMLYYQHKRPLVDKEIKRKIEEVMQTHKAYGHKRIALELKLNKKRILRIMRKFHLKPVKRRNVKFVKPDDSGKPETPFKNVIETFCPTRSNIVWVGDFTHIRFQNTWVYLATVMDIFTREVIGWHLSATHTKDLVIEAFIDALEKTKTAPLYFHSDQGSEYESQEYLDILENNKIIISMSRKSHPWENGYQESFYSGFKLDLGPTGNYQTIGELYEVIAQTIYYYNNDRIHTTLKTTPKKFRLSRDYLFKEMGT